MSSYIYTAAGGPSVAPSPTIGCVVGSRPLAGVVVVAVDYRLAPEHPAPRGRRRVRRTRVGRDPAEAIGRLGGVAVADDSAGGIIAALAALHLRGSDAAPDVLGLIYANTHLGADDGSMISNGRGFALDADDVTWFNRQWVPDPSRWSDGDVSPLMVDDLSGLASTVVVTCELDPLRDQAEMFAVRLIEAGVTLTARRERGMVHNFLLWDLVARSCADAGNRVAFDLAGALQRVNRLRGADRAA